MNKIALFQMWINATTPKYVMHLKRKHEAYAKSHAYSYQFFRKIHPLFKDYDPAWSRIGYMHDMLNMNIDTIVYIDADVEILMMHRRMEDIMNSCPETDFYVSDDHVWNACSSDKCVINTGFMIARNTQWTRLLFAAMLNPPLECSAFRWKRQWEQSCLQHILYKMKALRFKRKKKRAIDPIWNTNHTLCIINEVQNANVFHPYNKNRGIGEFARHFLTQHEELFNKFHYNETLTF